MKKERMIDVYLIITSSIVIIFGILDIISFITSIIEEKSIYIGYFLGISLVIMGILVLCKHKKRKNLVLSAVFYLLTGSTLFIEKGYNFQILQLLIFGVVNILMYILYDNGKKDK